ncbi:MAG: tetratricopeptide repeat protein [Phycisphaerales bacterium]|nr:tetratricopeptide repeat protein [Phycisphaerales bacterium]
MKSFRIALIAGGLAAAAFPGCSPGHGKYTTEFREQAQVRMAGIKAATSWDMAHQQFLAGDLKKAERSVDESIALLGSVPKSHVLRGRIMMEQGRLDEAVSSFDRALALEEKNVDAMYFKGVVMERYSRREQALGLYRQAAELKASEPQYALAVAEMMMDLGDVPGAKAWLEERRKNFENNPGVVQCLGHIAMIEGRSEDAAAKFQEASLLAPSEPAILEDLVRAQMACGRFADAETTIRRVLRESKEPRRDMLHLQAQCLIETGRPVEARAVLQRLTKDEEGPSDVRAWLALGKVSLTLNDEHRLRESATHLMNIAPQRHEGYVLFAMLQRRQQNLEGALKTLESGLTRAARSPGVGEAVILKGMILDDLGRRDEAVRTFELAVELSPDDAAARQALAGVRAKSGSTVTSAPIPDSK